ncbi:MAG TPA: acyl-CoA dehydrogenase C-terminal domain-containing protein, partial [Kiloniellales bacterium]
ATRHLANGADAASPGKPFLTAKIQTARFYADNILPRATAEAAAVMRGGESTQALDEGMF